MLRSQPDLALVPMRPRTPDADPGDGRAEVVPEPPVGPVPAGRLVAVGPGDVRSGAGGSERAPTGGSALPTHGTVGSYPVAGPGTPRAVTTPQASAVSELDVFAFPVQIGKVQPPLLPVETLSRDRLLEWMAAKIHSRLVLIVADPGHGKTTLLADWSRRTRVNALWYRLDEADRDWVVFVHHIVATGREVDPAFAPNTASLLRELSAGMIDRASIMRTLVAEVRAWVTGGTALLLDDYQVVDDVPEVREIVRELLLRGPERLSLVISTRRMPTLPLARLRALGEVAELTTADLRFDRAEMERLFRETYRNPLESDLLDDLARTTEGWAATLRLVETAVRGRPRHEVREVIRGLSARDGDLHDYLAEEVVGRMPLELQAFLERCSLLQVATPQLAAVAAAVSEADARRLLDTTEEAGLLSRRGRTGQAGRLLHPLVRSFLEGRLLDAVGPAEVAATHVRIATAAEPNSWWLAAHHFAAAGRRDDVARVLSSSLESILGSGGAQAAVDLIRIAALSDEAGWVPALQARAELRQGNVAEARRVALLAYEKSLQGDPTIPAAIALATLTTVEYAAGEYETAVGHAQRLRDATDDPLFVAIADSMISVADSMLNGSLSAAEAVLERTAALARKLGHAHYLGISHLNLAWLARAKGDADRVLRSANLALEALAATSDGPEMDTVRTVAAWGHAHKGDIDRARGEIDLALSSKFARGRFEALLESADVVGTYMDPERGWALVADAAAIGPSSDAERTYLELFRAEAHLRCGRLSETLTSLAAIQTGQRTGYPGFYIRTALCRAAVGVVTRAHDVGATLAEAAEAIDRQGAREIDKWVRLLTALADDPETASEMVVALWSVEPGVVIANAEGVLSRLGVLDDRARAVVSLAAETRPERWRLGLRRAVVTGDPRAKWAAGRILEIVGQKSDVRQLRSLSRELKGPYRSPAMGRQLARRTADRVWVEDQGRVVLRIGSRTIPGTEVRRRPLSLLCYLLTRPGMSATRDQVLDALWPDSDPDQATNSLHQTIYFLRRVIEPSYSDDLSPGYVNQDAELVWLDTELISSRSIRCRETLRELGTDPPAHQVLLMAAEYRGRFALDFSYEEWATVHRESLHARYLEVMERAIAAASASGRFTDAMELSRATLDNDPSLDHIQASLVKFYRLLGAHAAAAEQYQYYSTIMREELGVEPLPLDQL